MATDTELLQLFRLAITAHERAQRSMAEAEEAVAVARNSLSAQLVPTGAKIGDRFGVYVQNDLVQIEITSAETRITVARNVRPPVR